MAVLERVRRTGQPIRVTRFGQAVAETNPPTPFQPVRRFGRQIGSVEILGDIVGPTGEESDWEAARDPESEGDEDQN